MAVTVAASILSASPATAVEPEQIPLIGSEGPAEDACIGVGTITTLDKHLAVRERPDQYARKKDQLAPRTLVWICEKNSGENGEDWQGIVYPNGDNQKLGDCKVSSRVTAPEPYKGPCRFGWVHARDLRLVTI